MRYTVNDPLDSHNLYTYPTTDTTLIDYNLGALGYLRVKLTPTGHVILEQLVWGGLLQVDMANAAVPLNTPVYISFMNHGRYGDGNLNYQGAVYLPDNSQLGSFFADSSLTSHVGSTETYIAQFGWGVSVSSAYANFPQNLGWMSKFRSFVYLGVTPTPPTSDTSGGTQDYMLRQSTGSATKIADSGTGRYTLAAGPEGITINRVGPYPSMYTPITLPPPTFPPFGSESFSGNGTADNVPYYLDHGVNSGFGGISEGLGFFLHLSRYPTEDTTIVDYQLSTQGDSGYLRIKVTPSGHAILEMAAKQATISYDLAQGALPLSTTVYITFVNIGGYGEGRFFFDGAVYTTGGGALNTFRAYSSQPNPAYGEFLLYSARFGLGVSRSSSYANFTPDLGWMSKFRAFRGTSYPYMPDVDTLANAHDLQDYMVRQPLGPAAQLDDSSGNHHDLSPGPAGVTINLDGPYVSRFAPVSEPPARSEVLSPSEHHTTCATGKPVNCATGDFYHTFDDLSVPGRGVPLHFARTYYSLAAAQEGPFGFGWTDNYNMFLTTDDTGAMTVTEEPGSSVAFRPVSGGYQAPGRVLAALVDNHDGTLTFTRNKDQIRYVFTTPTTATVGLLQEESDRNGYATVLRYANGKLATVTDPANRALSFSYTTSGRLARVSDPLGRTVAFTYNAADELVAASDAGGMTQFTYDSGTHLLRTMTDPTGGTVVNDYNTDGQVITQTDALGRTTAFTYTMNSDGSQTSVITSPTGSVTVEQYRDNEMQALIQGYGTTQAATQTYTYDPFTLGVSSVTDPDGHTSYNTYDSRGNLLSHSDALNRTTSYAYDALNDTTAITDPLGNVTSMTYDAHGNLLSTSRSLVATAATSANNGSMTMSTTSIRRSAVVAAACQGSAATPLCAAGVHGLAACAGRCNPTIGATGERSRPLGRDVVRTFSVPQGRSLLGMLDDPASRGARTPTSVPSRARPASRRARGAASCSTTRLRCATATPRRPVSPSARYRSRDTVISIDDSVQGGGTDRFRYVGRWGHCKPCRDGARVGMYDQSSSFSRRAGDSYTLRFRGIGIALYSVHGPTHGIEEVTLDGRNRVLIDLYSARRTGDVLDHRYAHLADGVHVLTVRVTGRKNRKSGNVYVVADRVAITQAGIIPPRHTPTPPPATATRVATRIPTSTPRSTVTPSPTTMPPTTTPSAQPAPTTPTPATPTATTTPTPTSTATMVMPTATGTQTPTDTPTTTPIPPTNTSTATATMIPTTSTPTDTATVVPPSATNTSSAGATPPVSTISVTSTPAPPAATISPSATATAESTIPSTSAPTSTATVTLTTDTATAMAMATALSTATSMETSMPSPTASPTATRTPLPSIPCADAGPYTATTCLTYDPAHPGDVIARTDPDGHTARYTYDQYGNLTSASDPLGDTTTYTYDLIGRRTSATRPLGNVAGANPTSYTTAMAYNAFGDTTAITDAQGNITTYGYDGDQNLIATTDALGRQTVDGYNLDNERTSMTRPDGVTLQTGYDDAGNVINTTDGLSQSTSFAYDALNRLISTTAPLGRTTVYTYDLAGNKIAMTDPLSQTTAYTYNDANELVGVLRPDGTSLATGYDLDGRVASQTDGRGSTTSYGYDSLGRTVAVIDGLGRVTTYGYDLAGNRTALIDPMGRTTTSTYDAANRLVAVAYSDGSTPAVQYSYDADGNRTAMQDGTGTTRYTYDTLDRSTSIINGSGQMVGYGYDQAGQPITLIYPGGEQVTRAYDALGRVASVTDWLGHTTAFGYDGNGDVVSETYPNASSAVLSYNAASDLTGITDTVNGTPRWTFGYARNSLGQVSGVSDGIEGSTHSYGYDNTRRLTSDSGPGETRGWAYDAADNLATITTTAGTEAFAYDQANQLTALTTTIGAATTSVAYAYNTDGDRTAQGDGAGATGSMFGWDQADRLVTATVGTTTTASYAYDGDGLRQSKAVTATDSTTTTVETWDAAGGLPHLIQDGNIGYVYGPLGPIEQIDASDVPTYYYQDQLGSTRGLVNASGTTVGRYNYDAYGQVTSHTGTATTLQFAGQYTDAATGFQYLRARYYDPATQQFLSRDPLVRLTAQVYTYVSDDPLNMVDPAGLWGVRICASVTAGLGMAGTVQVCPIATVNGTSWGFTLTWGGGPEVTFNGSGGVGVTFGNEGQFSDYSGWSLTGGGSGGEGALAAGGDVSVARGSCGPIVDVGAGWTPGLKALSSPEGAIPVEYHVFGTQTTAITYNDALGSVSNRIQSGWLWLSNIPVKLIEYAESPIH